MISGTRYPVLPVALRNFQEKRVHSKSLNSGLHLEADPWRALCECCLLDDCILPEGGPGGTREWADQFDACLIMAAKRDGLTPEEALKQCRK